TRDQFRGEGAAGGGHLRTPRLSGIDRLIIRERPCGGYVRVTDREPVPLEIRGQWLGDGDRRDPEPHASVGQAALIGHVRCEERHCAPLWQTQRLARGAGEERW